MHLVQQPAHPTADGDEFDTLSEAMAAYPDVAWRVALIGGSDQHLQGWTGREVLASEQPDYTIIDLHYE